jgi:hypothetical protein
MPPAGFETAVPGCEWPHTHTLDRAVNGICGDIYYITNQSWKNEIEVATAWPRTGIAFLKNFLNISKPIFLLLVM